MTGRSYLKNAATIAVALTCSVAGMKAQTTFGNFSPNGCSSLPSYTALKTALDSAVATEASGLNNQMWATIVDRDGIVCAVAFSGVNRGAQWPGSRVISAQKANTANSFSLDASSNSSGSGQPKGLALSTANLYSAVQPGGSLFGLQESNPVSTDVAYQGAVVELWHGIRSDGRTEDRRRERVRRRPGALCGVTGIVVDGNPNRTHRRGRRRERGHLVRGSQY